MPIVINVRDTTRPDDPWHLTHHKDAKPIVTLCDVEIHNATSSTTLEDVTNPKLCDRCRMTQNLFEVFLE